MFVGVWKSKEELLTLHRKGKVFTPSADRKEQYNGVVSEWERAVRRTFGWYKNVPL